MKENTLQELEQKIKEVEQTIDDVKNFKNLRGGSRLKLDSYDEEYIVAFVGFFIMVNLNGGHWWNAETKTLEDVREDMIENSFNFTLIGDPLISDLEKELKDLKNQLEEALKPKELKCSDAPDGWYIISGKTFSGLWINESIQKGDVIFIKNGLVFMKDHGRFYHYQNEYCIEGIHKSVWDGYLVEKLP